MRLPIGFCVLFLTLPFLSAQEPARATEIDQQVAEMRRQAVEGKTFKSHVRVSLKLKNGNRMTGIVKDGVVVERMNGIQFVAAEQTDPGAGIRLHYWNGRRNFVFVPFAEIQDYRINARVSPQELALLDREQRQREAAERASDTTVDPANPTGDPVAAAAAPPTEPAPVARPGKAKASEATEAPKPGDQLTGELQNMFALLQEYPPSAGWNEAKRAEIARRQAVIGSKPSAKELKFVERFADWQRACTLFGQQAGAGDAAPPTDAESTGTGRSRRGRK